MKFPIILDRFDFHFHRRGGKGGLSSVDQEAVSNNVLSYKAPSYSAISIAGLDTAIGLTLGQQICHVQCTNDPF